MGAILSWKFFNSQVYVGLTVEKVEQEFDITDLWNMMLLN